MHEVRIVTQRFVLLTFLVVAVMIATLTGGRAGTGSTATDVWTVVIPKAFPDAVFTWRLKSDSTYEEDGVEAATGRSIQTMMTGRWGIEDGRMVLRQNEYAYVFEGVITGNRYTGTLTLSGKTVSHFCAAKGATPPDLKTCKDDKIGA